MRALAVLLMAGVALALHTAPPYRRVLQLPAGVVHLEGPWPIGNGVEVRGSPAGTVLRMEAGFDGAGALVVGNDVYLHDFAIDGNRSVLEERAGLPPSNTSFARFTHANAIYADGVHGLRVENIRVHDCAGFAVLASRSHDVSLFRIAVTDSGSRNALGRNNSTGGILLEEGTADFRVTECELLRIRGNGVWTHSLYTSPRNTRGAIARNRFEDIGRDAIQVGHATDILVEENFGLRIGFPLADVDIENLAVPVGIDTAGNVERSSYAQNRFEELDGKCFDLDGFHDGEVRANVCRNSAAPERYRYGNFGVVMNNSNPDMQSRNVRVVDNLIEAPSFGAIFVIGTGNLIARNRLFDINRAHCNEEAARFGCYYAPGEPDMLRSAIYLGKGAARPAPARANVIEHNEITGYKMESRCIARAPGIEEAWNTVRDNVCRNQ